MCSDDDDDETVAILGDFFLRVQQIYIYSVAEEMKNTTINTQQHHKKLLDVNLPRT